MRTSLSILILVGGLLGSLGCKSPEERLAGYISETNDILSDHKKDPEAGLVELRKYLRKNLPDMAEVWGELVGELDGLSGEALRGRTAEIAKVLKTPLEDLVKASDDFEDAIDESEDARDWLNDLAADYAKTADIELLQELSKTLSKAAGGSRDRKCKKVLLHFADLVEASMKGLDSPELTKQIAELREGDGEMMGHCRRQTEAETDCMLRATSMEGIAKCAR